MSATLFFFFSSFAILNVYLPIFFRNMGYSPTVIGFLMSLLEIAGIVFTFVFCKFPQKSGKYGFWLIIISLLLIILPIPMLNFGFLMSALSIIVYAIPSKTAVPISDSYVNILLGKNTDKYGMVRVFGSLGFIIASLVLQFFIKPENLTQMQCSFLMMIPGVLMLVTLFITPKLLEPVEVPVIPQVKDTSEKSKSFFKQFSPTFWLFLMVLTFGNIGNAGPYKFFSLYVDEFLKSDVYGFLWSLSAICEIPTLFFSFLFIRKYGSKKLILFCVAMISVRNFVYVLFPSVTGAAIGQMFHCFTFGLLHPSTVIFIGQEVIGSKQVTAQALSSVGSAGVASVFGSFLGGIIIDHIGYPSLYTIFGIIPLVGLVLYFCLRKKVKILHTFSYN